MKRLFIWLIRLYQKYISPRKRTPCCRFYPTCSSYAIEALEKRGFFVGSLLAVMRILRCQPFGPSGWDPVPEKGLRNPKDSPQPLTKYYYPEEFEPKNFESEESAPEDPKSEKSERKR